MKITVKYYRVPMRIGIVGNRFSIVKHRKGKPTENDLHRFWRGFGFDGNLVLAKPYERGGLTECIIELDDGTSVTGISTCSFSDHFCYKKGYQIAKGRALKLLEQMGK